MNKHFRWNKNFLTAVVDNHIIDYPSPINLTYAWSFGALAGICLVLQLITGIFLAMYYTPHTDHAFNSVEFIMRDINNGWLIRYLHANGASMFFIVVYSHMFRGLYYGSYMTPREHLWGSGVLIFLLMMGTAFMGYVLPWGQMSFWGASVITRLITVIPFAGDAIVEWFWGGYSIDNPTLKRIFSLHYLFPFVIAALVIIHIALLHKDGSNNPLGTESNVDKISFYPYFYVKDLFSFMFFVTFFSIILFYFPNTLGHPDNYIPADPLKTPLHIVPEWYFLPFYAILRSIPNKVGGVLAMFGAIVVLFLLPFINTSEIRSSAFRPIFRRLYWFLFIDFVLLGWLGQAPIEEPYMTIGQIATFIYFFFFVIIFPQLGTIETYLIKKK
jgi:quinol-cytochrome oxidoreductase complex cytochrome b subunit